jgi:glycosyltransferase involved in cell wall biosynthesis
MMLNIATGLSQRGHDVDLVLVEATGDFLKQVPDEIEIVDLSASRVLTSFSKLVRYLRRSSPDLLLSTITPTNVIAVWATLVPGVDVKHVVRVARPESEAAKVQDNTKKEQLTAALSRRSYPYADEIVAISEGVADDLRSNTSLKRIHVIYNPVVTEQLRQQAAKPVDHPWFSKDIPVVLGVGRLVDQKDFETLVRAFAHLRDQRNAKLVIYGDGKKRSDLELLIDNLGIEEDVDLPGFTDNPYKYMANADVFVNSAKHEGFGNVIIETMATGTPIVATDCPGAPAELLSNGEFGRLVPVGNPEPMAEGINEILEDPTKPALLYDRAEDFSLEAAIEKYSTVLFRG